jgi:hypothetical protein
MALKTVSRTAALILVLLGGSALAGQEGTPTSQGQRFSALRNVPAEALSSEEMDKVQGKAFAGFTLDGRYLYWWDTGSAQPLAAYDTTIPGVNLAWQQINYFGGPQFAPPDLMWNLLGAADPQAVYRVVPGGCWTANGPPIPGFTVGTC